MIKSTYIKLMLTFIGIICASFVMLSVIFSVMMQGYSAEESDRRLKFACEYYATDIEKRSERTDFAWFSHVVKLLVNNHPEIMTQMNDIHLVFVSADKDDASKTTVLRSTLGDGYEGKSVLISQFRPTGEDDLLACRGYIVEGGSVRYRAFARPIRSSELPQDTVGYVIAMKSVTVEEKIIGATRRAAITASLWVMVAAMIAVYFVSERLLSPMREMTAAAKKYGKGDFSTRVEVRGNDETAQLASAFNAMAESLENYDKMRNSFLASVSHDLRTPMTTIAGFIDGINSGAIPPEKQPHYLGIISSEVHRLSRLVGQILDISRLASGERKFNMTDFDVAEVSRLILISFEKQIGEKKLDVMFDSADCVPVRADKDAVYQVIYNLCHNAIKFSKEGGKLSVRIASDGKTVDIVVYNEGVGIPKEDVPHVFDRFYKSDKSRGMDKTGFGLGLFICKSIVQAHEGEISVVSEEGKNCEFTVKLKAGTMPKKQADTTAT